MNGSLTYCLLCAFVAAHVLGAGQCLRIRDDVGSPLDMARDLSRLVASGVGCLMPGDAPYEECRGIIPFDQAVWPSGFVSGLTADVVNGFTVYDVSVRFNDYTGHAVFANGDGIVFFDVIPSTGYDRDWYASLRGLCAHDLTMPYMLPSHVVAHWLLVDDPDAFVAELETASATPQPLLRMSPPATEDLAVTNLSITGISVSSDFDVTLSVSWPTNSPPKDGILDVWAETNLAHSSWCVVASVPVPDWTNTMDIVVPAADTPGYTAFQTSHLDTCSATTNIVADPFDPASTYTNVSWNCDCFRHTRQAFFRIGTRADNDRDGLLDAWEMLVYGTSLLSDDSDDDGMPDGWEIENGLRPICDDALVDDDGDGIPNIYEYFNFTDPQVVDYELAPKIVAGGDGGDSVASLQDAFDASDAFSIIEVAPGVHDGSGWTELFLPAHPVLVTSPDGGRGRSSVLRHTGNGMALMYLCDGQDFRTVFQGLVIDMRGSNDFQTAFWLGGNVPFPNPLRGSAFFKDIYVCLSATGGDSVGWFLRHHTPNPTIFSGCTVDAAGASSVRGIYAVDGPPLLIEQCSFVNFPHDPTDANFAFQLESTSANWGDAPPVIPVQVANCLFDESFTNALVLAPLELGVDYVVTMDHCLAPSQLAYIPETNTFFIVTNATLAASSHLNPSSPAIGMGAPSRYSLYDIDGQRRDGATPDIGSDSFAGIDPSLDTDGDGISDEEEIWGYGTNPFLPDSDGDGNCDLLEIQDGTDPLDGGSRLAVLDLTWYTDFSDFDGLKVALFDAAEGGAPLFDPWTPTGIVNRVENLALVYTDSTETSMWVWNDFDLDDHFDAFETGRQIAFDAHARTNRIVVTNLFSYLDHDQDDMPDGWEWRHGLSNTNKNDAIVDCDDDGLINLHEYWMDCDPHVCDGTNTLLSIFARSVDDRLAGKNPTNSMDIYVDYLQNATNLIFRQDTNCWACGLDFSCESPWHSGAERNLRAGTMLSTMHIVFANHYPYSSGTKLFFQGSDGNIYTNMVTSSKQVPNNSDIRVGVLASPLTNSVSIVKIPPPDFRDYVGDMAYLPILAVNQFENAVVYEGRSIREKSSIIGNRQVAPGYFECGVPSVKRRSLFFKEAIGGDSGSPRFLVKNDELLLLNVMWHAPYGNGVLLSWHANTVLNAVRTPEGETPSIVDDWSAYPKRVHRELKN